MAPTPPLPHLTAQAHQESVSRLRRIGHAQEGGVAALRRTGRRRASTHAWYKSRVASASVWAPELIIETQACDR